ncbi:MAG TPA: carboxypeptidase regulatory-like domain-containing protein [Bryobacteraceae bacterium]|nr:carboxypeptidase regulatory-like domain-containing protein [Bryobacteraceae bacterium]
MPRVIKAVLTALALTVSVQAQTTQGIISGKIVDSVTGRPVAGASVSYSAALASTVTLRSDIGGYFFLPLLSAGTYAIRVSADHYQPQELQQIELPVAGRVQVDFRLRPLSDVWESGQYRSVFLPGTKTIVTVYGPDVDPSRSGTFEAIKGQRGTLDTSQSYVIDPVEIGDLPLLGRDVFAMLVSLPTVTADSGTGRGLGVSVAGQRPSSSNYLLDGVENDNYLITGPLVPVAPEAVQEYRISTNNYSAEYGRTAGFIANAVTRAGGNAYHGMLYEYLKNDALNAADFQDNLMGLGRRPDKENEFGYQAGGPVIPRGGLRSRLFFSSALDRFISHSEQNKQTYVVPSPSFLTLLGSFVGPTTRQLLTEFPPPPVSSTGLFGEYEAAPPAVVDRTIALERGDYTTRSGRDHLLARLALARTSEPDFIWSPYSQFISGLNQDSTGIFAGWQRSWTPRLTSEFKLSYTDDSLSWDRAHPEIPTLLDVSAIEPIPTTLPGSPAFYGYRNHNRSFETIYSGLWTRNKHVIAAGAGLLLRYNSGFLTAGRDGEYLFNGTAAFASDLPYTFAAAIDRENSTPQTPNYNRFWQYVQTYFFAQDSFRVTPRLTLNYGIRYERFGAPTNTGAVKDLTVSLGAGSSFTARLASASLVAPGPGDQQEYGPDNNDWAPRFGFSWDALGNSKTILRGGFGIFYDRPFDNLWQNVRNNNILLQFYQVSAPLNYLAPVNSVLQMFSNQTPARDFPSLTLLDPHLRDGYSQSSFLGVQQQVRDDLVVEINGTSALGRRLITTDIVNRAFTVPSDSGGLRPNENLPDIAWRSGQGLSDYYAFSALARYRTRSLLFQAAYTWSHSIDNQSDPLTGDFFDLNFSAIAAGGQTGPRSAFTRQYDSSGDRGSSQFDQRHNLFLLGIWRPEPRWQTARFLTRGWSFSWLAAFRTGTPYTVNATSPDVPDSGGAILNQRADQISPNATYSNPIPGPGGVYLLNPAAFATPAADQPGTTSRNEFRGPGLYSLDVSAARSFAIPRLREGTTFTLRADFFNVLNHANLGNPDNLLGDPNFGLSTFGRQGVASGFPALAPLNETARQIQILLRLQF